jgi:hypothetical protein
MDRFQVNCPVLIQKFFSHLSKNVCNIQIFSVLRKGAQHLQLGMLYLDNISQQNESSAI